MLTKEGQNTALINNDRNTVQKTVEEVEKYGYEVDVEQLNTVKKKFTVFKKGRGTAVFNSQFDLKLILEFERLKKENKYVQQTRP